MRHWSRPSLAGRRVALERKWRCNVEQYGGQTKMVTLTPPGADVVPLGDKWRDVGGHRHYLVEWPYGMIWNHTAQARASRLYEAAQKAADRWVRRQGWKGELPRQLGN